MANRQLLSLVILSLINASIQDVTENKISSQEESPLAGIAKEIMKEQNLENIGGMVNSFIQSEGAKQLMGNVLQNLASNENSGQLLQSLGDLFNGDSETDGTQNEKRSAKAKTKSRDDINPMELLSGIGSIVGAMQGAGGDGQGNPAALLQGLGSILGAGNNADGGNNAAALLQGLGSLMGSASQNGKDDDGNPTSALLQGLGSILGAASNGQKEGAENSAALLQGLSSLLTAGKEGSGNGINPEMIGNLVNMFANSHGGQKKSKKSKNPKKTSGKSKKARKDETSTPEPDTEGRKSDNVRTLTETFPIDKKTGGFDLKFVLQNFPLFVKLAKTSAGPRLQKILGPLDDLLHVYTELTDKERDTKLEKLTPRFIRILDAFKEFLDSRSQRGKEGPDVDNSFDLSGVIGMASSFLSQTDSEGGKSASSFMDYLPMIMNTINSFTGPEAEERAEGHSGHSWALPPVIERIHIYFDNFVNSDMGKELINYVEGQQAFKVFKDENGEFSYDRFKELIENHSFRRHWIQRITKKLVNLLKVVSDENVQKKYIGMGITFTNSFLKNTGFPENSLLDTKNPVQSITNFINFAAKKYLDADVDARDYVEPAVFYIKDILIMAKKSIATQELTDKLTDTINMEIIEPITRVNRAYRFAKSEPTCDRYLFCIMNQETTSPYNSASLPELRNALYKGYSLVAGWFLRLHTGTSYWDIYDAVTKAKNCQEYHNPACDGFYHEEVRATTEYIHNEL